MEMTSQGALLYRHRFIELDMLVFTNLSPEHIEAHGSFEAYKGAKLAIARNMARSGKRPRTIVAECGRCRRPEFLACTAERKIGYGLKDAEPYMAGTSGPFIRVQGPRHPLSPVRHVQSLKILAAMAAAEALGVPLEAMAAAVEGFGEIPGRVERIRSRPALRDRRGLRPYAGFAREALPHIPARPEGAAPRRRPAPHRRPWAAPGGRDAGSARRWAASPTSIATASSSPTRTRMTRTPGRSWPTSPSGVTAHKPLVVMDRREAIREAVKQAKAGDTILITGKGTDPYIMGPNGAKTPWSDAKAAREEAANRHA